LRYVTRIVDQGATGSNLYPFTYALVGGTEQLTVTIPASIPGGAGIAFYLENSLTNPVVAGNVSGTLTVMAAPSFYRIVPAWAEPGQKIQILGHNLTYGQPPTVTIGGVAAQIISATALSVDLRVATGTTAGPIAITNEMATTQLTGPFISQSGTNHPGFFVVAGQSVVQSVTAPRPTLAYGDTLVVRGQNIARLGGICVLSSGVNAPAGYLALRRPEAGNSILGDVTQNTEMKVLVEYNALSFATGTPIQVYAPSAPPGDMGPSVFSCAANGATVIWPAP
jgi:hypothetical protein